MASNGALYKAPNTPPSKSVISNSGVLNSTPHSKGTGSNARYKVDGRVAANIRLVEEDLESTDPVPYLTMLKALLMRKRNWEDIDAQRVVLDMPELEAHGDRQLGHLVKASVDFCNNSTQSADFKLELKKMLQCKTEEARYQPLVVALNKLLSHFKKETIGDLDVCKPEEATLYTINDPNPLFAEKLSENAASPRRKPDLYEAIYSDIYERVDETGRKSLGSPDEGFKKVAALMENAPKWRQMRKAGEAGRWADVIHCLEVKNSKAEPNLKRIDEAYEREVMLAPAPGKSEPKAKRPSPSIAEPISRSTRSTAASSTARSDKSRKRPAEEDAEEPVSKRSKNVQSTHESATSSISRPLPPSETMEATPAVQCAFYGLELLRSHWDRTHSIVSLLTGQKFQFNWYDSQGCVATEEIDIVSHLPLFVATIVLFQRFKSKMRGRAGLKIEAELDGVLTSCQFPQRVEVPWALRGRRPVAAVPVGSPVPKSSPNEQESAAQEGSPTELPDFFMKYTWREETRDSEAAIIAEAKERAKRYLPEGHQTDVLDHMPQVEYSQDYDELATRHIRICAGVGATQSRIPALMISRRLEPMETLEPEELTKKMWEILRCLVLLWALGVAHGDVSLWNIMIRKTGNDRRMVLNDFDLAALMKPGEESPPKRGFERTGTRPFMALDLLAAADGSIKRICRYDVESLLWCLLWYCIPMWSWNAPTCEQARAKKITWLDDQLTKPTPETHLRKGSRRLFHAVKRVFHRAKQAALNSVIGDDSDTDADQPQVPKEITYRQLIDFLHKGCPCPPEYSTWEWLAFCVGKTQAVDRSKAVSQST